MRDMTTYPCPHCGQSHPAVALFCPVTGRDLPRPQPSRTLSPSVVGFLAIGLLGIGLIIAGVWLMLDSGAPKLPTQVSGLNLFATPDSTNLNTTDGTTSLAFTQGVIATSTMTPSSTPSRTPLPTETLTPSPTLTLSPAATSTATPAPTHAGPQCSISVTGRYASLWSQYPQLGCPLSANEKSIQDAEQKFQNGHLFWRADIDRFYVIYDGGGATFGSWASYSRQTGAIQNCPENAPGGLAKPTSGFGDVWCALGGGNSPLGWALDREYGFVAGQGIRVQDFEKGVIFQDSDSVQRNLVYVLTNSGFYRVSPDR